MEFIKNIFSKFSGKGSMWGAIIGGIAGLLMGGNLIPGLIMGAIGGGLTGLFGGDKKDDKASNDIASQDKGGSKQPQQPQVAQQKQVDQTSIVDGLPRQYVPYSSDLTQSNTKQRG